MRKRFTKIICAAVAAISAFGLAFSCGCGRSDWSAVTEKDNTAGEAQVESNGGFLVQTGDYVYFINGKQTYTVDNSFGSVLRGSVQRLKKSDLESGNYSSSQTIVPSVIYSGQYNAGIYIYDGHIYYTTPSSKKDGSGNVLNSTLEFRRTTLDGGSTSSPLWECADNAVDYRYVKAGETVYILYAISENLYGTSATNIHSVNTNTGENKLLAYNVGEYVFDTDDASNPVAYYTMSVPRIAGESENYSYNQIYRVRADASQSPREYDFSDVEGYDGQSNPIYVNYGDYVLDGIGSLENQTDGRITQFNYAHWNTGKQYTLKNGGYNYSLNSYEDGVLYYTRKENTVNSNGAKYVLKDDEIDSDGNGRVDDTWDAVDKNSQIEKFIILSDTNEYEFIELGGTTYAIHAGSTSIEKGVLENGVVKDSYPVVRGSDGSNATILCFREEETASGANTYMYYSLDGGNGYTFYRVAIDGDKNAYNQYPQETELDATLTYTGVRILDLDACADWYKPEFVGNTIVFASEVGEMSSYNYIMACNLSVGGKMPTNRQIKDLNDKFEGVDEKIQDYNDETNADGTAAYKNLSNALTYLWNTGDEEYLDELIQAYVDIEGKDKEYLYSEESAQIYHDFAKAEGDWEDYKDSAKQYNGETVYSNSRMYYYGVLGKMTQSDETGLRNAYRANSMQSYPVDDTTWWEGLSAGAKAGFIIGMCAVGLTVLGGITVGVLLLVNYLKNKKSGGVSDAKIKVDITDDKSVNVYDDGGQQ